MKNVFKLSSLLFVGLVLFQVSCKKDEPAPADPLPDPAGKWALTSAVLVEPNPLTITSFPVNDTTFITLEVPAGADGAQTTTMLVGGALAATTCTDPANYASFYIELTADNNALVFNCAGEGSSGTAGTWAVEKASDGTYTLTLSVSLQGISQPVPIILEGMELTDTTLSGRAVGYPMKKDFLKDISEPGNLQTMTTDMTFTKVP